MLLNAAKKWTLEFVIIYFFPFFFSLEYVKKKSRREILLEYVQNVQPEFMELFVKRAPQQVLVTVHLFSHNSWLLCIVFSAFNLLFGVVEFVLFF